MKQQLATIKFVTGQLTYRTRDPATGNHTWFTCQDKWLKRFIMKINTTRGSEKKPDKVSDRLHRDNALAFVTSEKQRYIFDSAGWQEGTPCKIYPTIKKWGGFNAAP